jgi:hypothetical protein
LTQEEFLFNVFYGSIKMALTEKDVEKKTLSEIGSLIIGYEKKIKELAGQIKTGQAKPADMMALSSDLALLKKARDKKSQAQGRTVKREQPKAAAPLKSYDDYLKDKKN